MIQYVFVGTVALLVIMVSQSIQDRRLINVRVWKVHNSHRDHIFEVPDGEHQFFDNTSLWQISSIYQAAAIYEKFSMKKLYPIFSSFFTKLTIGGVTKKYNRGTVLDLVIGMEETGFMEDKTGTYEITMVIQKGKISIRKQKRICVWFNVRILAEAFDPNIKIITKKEAIGLSEYEITYKSGPNGYGGSTLLKNLYPEDSTLGRQPFYGYLEDLILVESWFLRRGSKYENLPDKPSQSEYFHHYASMAKIADHYGVQNVKVRGTFDEPQSTQKDDIVGDCYKRYGIVQLILERD